MKTIPTTTCGLAILAVLLFALTGCGDSESGDDHTNETGHSQDNRSVQQDREGNGHAYDDDHDHDDEVDLEPIVIDGMTIELAQSHGGVAPGKEGHLVVKLPYSDNGATVVRAWIGTEDRTLSFVGRGEYAASHDDYDIHAMAPDPLPENTMWWIEIERPDGTKVVGSAKPFME